MTSDPLAGRRRVALVHVPFGSTRYPSIQLGLLQAVLRRHGIEATTHYLGLRFAATLGWQAYELLGDPWCRLIGEWIFARAAFGEEAPDARRLLATSALPIAGVCRELGWSQDRLLRLREEEAPAFVEACLDTVAWDRYDVVGIGSMFEQNCAALALARGLKARHPRLVTVFGGANFEDPMGLEHVRAFPWIDYAVIGEGDRVFPALLERLAAGEDPAGMPGVACRRGGDVVFGGRAPLVRDLDALPVPDYTDFFETAAEVGLPDTLLGLEIELPFESARGCWWGARHPCTFCGFNGLGMAYRAKSPPRVLAELDELARRHGRHAFYAVDNVLDHRYAREVFPVLAERGRAYSFFYEVKTNLTPAQLGILARGGVRRVTAGIESLDTRILTLMRKGVTAVQNVRFLKWAHHCGIRVSWHILVGLPGERPEDYARQMAILRLIPHLPPPAALVPIRLDRFSPYFAQPDAWGIRNVRADPRYACVYPAGTLDPERIAYFFEYEASGALPLDTHGPLYEHLGWWRAAWQGPVRPTLTYVRGAGGLTITDARCPGATPAVHRFDERAARVYEACDGTPRTLAGIQAHLRGPDGGVETAAVLDVVRAFTTLGIVLESDGRHLGLALPAPEAPQPVFA